MVVATVVVTRILSKCGKLPNQRPNVMLKLSPRNDSFSFPWPGIHVFLIALRVIVRAVTVGGIQRTPYAICIHIQHDVCM